MVLRFHLIQRASNLWIRNMLVRDEPKMYVMLPTKLLPKI